MNNVSLDDDVFIDVITNDEPNESLTGRAADEVFLIKENADDDSQDEYYGEGDVAIKTFKATNVRKDLHNIIFLMFLYFLQGIPLGLTGSLPFILGSRNVTYAQQGTFSFAFWPFSMKLLWAPVVDSVFIRKFGRRKSWLVPMQYIMGFFMIAFANYVHSLLEDDEKTNVNMSKGHFTC
jgi:PAT family acetyl-CoA transporter-like MFS transporter 1